MSPEHEAQQGLLRSDHRYRHDGYVPGTRSEEADARFASDQRTALAPVSFWKEPEDLSAGQHAQRGDESSAVAFTPSYGERAGVPNEESEQRIVERLDLRHVADRQIKVDRDQRRVLPVDVVGD